MTANEIRRIKLQADVAKFLDMGGKVDVVDHTANHNYSQPVKRPRREQVEYMRRFSRIKG